MLGAASKGSTTVPWHITSLRNVTIFDSRFVAFQSKSRIVVGSGDAAVLVYDATCEAMGGKLLSQDR